MHSQTDRNAFAATRRNILLIWIGSFVAPPVIWMLVSWFLGLWPVQEMLTIISSPLLIVYVTGCNIFGVTYLRKQMSVIAAFRANPDASPQKAQHAATALPKVFLILIALYGFIGPSTGMLWKPFLTRAEYSLGAFLGISLMLLFSVPLFMTLLSQWERLTANVPLSRHIRALQLRGKIFLSAYLVFIGGILLMLILAYSCFLNADSIESGLSALITKGTILALLVLANAALVMKLFTGQIIAAVEAVTQQIKHVAEGDFETGDPVMTKDELGYLFLSGQNMAVKIRTVLQETERLTKAVRQGQLDVRIDTATLTGGWLNLANGVNNVIDAFMDPFNVTAEHLDRIAKGDLPDRVTEQFQGDFVKVIDNLNQCIDTTVWLSAEIAALTETALQGRFDIRGNAESFGGDYGVIVKGINNIISALVGHIDQIPLPLIILDTELSINFINRAGANLLGQPQETLLGQKCYNLFHTTDCHNKNCACDRAMQSGQTERSETTASPNGQKILASYTGIPLRDSYGTIIGVLEIFMDQTNIKQAMQAVEQQNWLRTGQAELSDVMRGEQDLTTLAKNVITYLAGYLKADIGTFYLAHYEAGGVHLRLQAAHAYTHRDASRNRLEPGEGLAGQAAADLETVLYSEVPEDYLPIKTEFGYEAPNEVLVSPFLYQNELKGVIEIGTTGRFSDNHIEFLEQASENIAVVVHSSQTRQQMQEFISSQR